MAAPNNRIQSGSIECRIVLRPTCGHNRVGEERETARLYKATNAITGIILSISIGIFRGRTQSGARRVAVDV